MAISLVQTHGNTSSSVNPTVTMGNTTTGNVIVVSVYTSSSTAFPVTSITDSQSNTYTMIGAQENAANTGGVQLWYAKNITGGTTPTITVNYSSPSGLNMAVIAREYSGLDTRYPFMTGTNGSAAESGTGTTVSTPLFALLTGYSNILVVGAATEATGSNTWSISGAFSDLTTQTNGGGLAMLDQIPTTAVPSSAYTIVFTTSGSSAWACIGAIFRAATPIYRISSQDSANTSGSGNVTATFPAATTPGNLIVVAVFTNGAQITLGAGLTGGTVHNAGIDNSAQFFAIAYIISTGQTSVKVLSTGAGNMMIQAYEYVGLSNPILLDAAVQNGNTTASANTWATGAISTVYPSELVFEILGVSNTITSPSVATGNLLTATAQARLVVAEYIPDAILSSYSDTFSWTTARNRSALVYSFAPPTARFLTLLGVGT